MINTVNEYLEQLKMALQGCDAATMQDALADAEEHLRTALENARRDQVDPAEELTLSAIIEEYGSPEEVAAAYREIDRRLPPGLTPAVTRQDPGIFTRFFSVMADSRAWGALIYMLISLLTGILYFSWAITGIFVSVSLIILIIGLPFLALFMLSVRGLAVLEGRIVEALLGLRMPRRPIFFDQTRGWWERLKELILSGRTWKAMLYLLLMLPIGMIYFTVMVTLIALGLGMVLVPFAQLIFNFPVMTFNTTHYYLPLWSLPLMVAGGILLVVGSMHLARLIGRWHGSFAKSMLVND